jgi:uncharacterized protein (DUF2147 family)
MSRRVAPLSATLGAVFALAAIGPLGAEPRAPASIIGHYRVPGSEMIIAIADCGAGQLCGRIATLGKLAQSSDGEQQAQRRGLCGVAVLTELHPTEDGWQGRLHDPELGDDYTLDLVNLWPLQGTAPGAVLSARRYRAPPLLTRTMPKLEAWTRVAPPAASCGAATPTS